MLQDTIQKRKTENKDGEPYITKNDEPFVRYKIGGLWITDFSNSQFPEGTLVNYAFKTEGEFKNITKITSATVDIQTADQIPQNKTEFDKKWDGAQMFEGLKKDMTECIQIAGYVARTDWTSEDVRTTANALFIEARKIRREK